MTETASEQHDRVAFSAARLIVDGCDGDKIRGMIIVETLIVAFLSHAFPNLGHATTYLDVMTERVVQRLHDWEDGDHE